MTNMVLLFSFDNLFILETVIFMFSYYFAVGLLILQTCLLVFSAQSSLRQYSTMNSYSLFFFANYSKSSPVCFLRLRSMQFVSNQSLMILCFSGILMSPDRTAQNNGVLPSVVCILKIEYLSGWSSKNSIRKFKISKCP